MKYEATIQFEVKDDDFDLADLIADQIDRTTDARVLR
jgi:hypothetical protein